MTNTALKAQIDSQITNETLPNSVSPTDVGGNLKAVVDYVDQEVLTSQEKVKNSIIGFLSYDGTDFIFTSVINQVSAIINWTDDSGTIIGTTSTAVLTSEKTIVKDQSLTENGGYIITGRRVNSTNFTMSFTNTDGTNTTVPNFSNMPIEIDIYI